MDKAPDAFRTISEVADEIDVPQHVLRFWESRFTQIKPMKRGGGRRYYRPDDVDLLRGVRHLLYGEGYTIRGVQRILRDEGAAFVQDVWRAGANPPPPQTDEDLAEDDFAAAAESRAETKLALFSLPEAEPPREERRGPTLVAPAQRPVGAAAADKLRAALAELVACRRVIDAALSDADAAEESGRSAEI